MLRPEAIKNSQKQSVQQVESFLRELWTTYKEKDLPNLLEKFSAGPELVAIGTGQDEFVLGFKDCLNLFKRDFDQCRSIEIKPEFLSIEVEGKIAWVASKVEAKVELPDNECFAIQARCTNVLKMGPTGWKIVQHHFSAPLCSQPVGESFSTNERN